MKDLGDAKRILGMDIYRKRDKGELHLRQTDYIKRVLKKFNMHEAKAVIIPLGAHLKLSENQSPTTEEEEKYINKVPYANVVGSIMYLMICCRDDIAHAISVACRYMANPGVKHWEALKWILR